MTNQKIYETLSRIFKISPPYTLECEGLNTTFSASSADGARRFIRIARADRTLAEIETELTLVDAIADTARLAVMRPLSGLDGTRIAPLARDGGTRYATVYAEAPGEQPEHTPESMLIAGEALRALHQQIVQPPPDQAGTPSSRTHPTNTVGALLSECMTRTPQHDKAFQFLERKQVELDFLARSDCSPWPIGPCHGDFRLGNTRLHNGRIWLFDWESCHIGHVWKDAARIAWWLGRLAPPDANACWKAFLGGYAPQGAPRAFETAIRRFMVAHEIEALHSLVVHHVLSSADLDLVVNRAVALADRIQLDSPFFPGKDRNSGQPCSDCIQPP